MLVCSTCGCDLAGCGEIGSELKNVNVVSQFTRCFAAMAMSPAERARASWVGPGGMILYDNFDNEAIWTKWQILQILFAVHME